MTNAQSPEAYADKNVVDTAGDKIGKVAQVYVNDTTGAPDWITVKTGMFGKDRFAPLYGASFSGEDVVLPYGKDVVKDAPDVSDASHLDADEQQSLYSYYERYLGAGGGGQRTETASDSGTVRTEGGTGRSEGHDTSGPTTDNAMTRSEEHLNVGTQQVEAGRARLRKYVVTEQQTVNVPVSHEEVRVEREAITDANRGDALDGPAISEEEHEVVLHAEQPVVTTEAVPVERVRLGTETVTDTQNVSGEVRKEQVEVVDETDSNRRNDNR